jgi:hypothetical protein
MNIDNIKIGNCLFKIDYIKDNKNLANHTVKSNKIIQKIINNSFQALKDSEVILNVQLDNINNIEIRVNEDKKIAITYHFINDKSVKLRVVNKKLNNKLLSVLPGMVNIQRDIWGEEIIKSIQKDNRLYLYSSGGGGHKSAKDAQMERFFKKLLDSIQVELYSKEAVNIDIDGNIFNSKIEKLLIDERLKDPAKLMEWCKQSGLIKDVDILIDYLGKIGKWASNQWDEAQKVGDVKKQESLASKQWLSDLFFGPIIFFATLSTLIQTKPKQVVSTQAMATRAILFAIKLYNKLYKPKEDPPVQLHLYMTDMPTNYAMHFFDALKRLTNVGGKKHLTLYAPKLEEGKTWQALCGLKDDQVKELDVQDLPVRLDFLNAVKEYKVNPADSNVEIKISGHKELELLHEVINYQTRKEASLGDIGKQGAQVLNYSMQPQDKGCFIMLGSQPTKIAIQGYIQEFLELARLNPNVNYHVFAFAGKFEESKDCFYKELCAYIKDQPEWPHNLSFLPLSFQTPKQLVSLEMRCDTITRSGGATIMELFVLKQVNEKNPELPQKNRYIHAQPVEERSLEESIPLWERGNFFFLQNKMGKDKVKVIDPDSFKAVFS